MCGISFDLSSKCDMWRHCSYLFLKAGLLILESHQQNGATEIGFYALSFIAGLNVDKFIAKIEDVAQAVWGIEKSRAAKSDAGEKS